MPVSPEPDPPPDASTARRRLPRSPSRLRRGRPFGAGSVLGRGLSLWVSNVIPILLVTLVVVCVWVVPLYLLRFAWPQVREALGYELAVWVGGLVTPHLLSGFVVRGVCRGLRDQRPRFFGAFVEALRRLPAIVGVLAAQVATLYAIIFPLRWMDGSLTVLATMFVTVLFLCGFGLSIAIATVEDRRCLDSIWRSWTLTKGDKAGILLIHVILFLVFTFGHSVILGTLLTAIAEWFDVWVWSYMICAGILAVSIYSVILATIYHDLTRRKEGVVASDVAGVFD